MRLRLRFSLFSAAAAGDFFSGVVGRIILPINFGPANFSTFTRIISFSTTSGFTTSGSGVGSGFATGAATFGFSFFPFFGSSFFGSAAFFPRFGFSNAERSIFPTTLTSFGFRSSGCETAGTSAGVSVSTTDSTTLTSSTFAGFSVLGATGASIGLAFTLGFSTTASGRLNFAKSMSDNSSLSPSFLFLLSEILNDSRDSRNFVAAA